MRRRRLLLELTKCLLFAGERAGGSEIAAQEQGGRFT